jgi:glycosyltransferase involved in cell wall biosynthesis
LRLDIVIPAHNEQHRIDAMLRAFRSRLISPEVRFLVAMDCCTDGTAEIVDSHAALDTRVEGITYPKLGKGGVIMETLRRCDADVVGFVDADCATPPAEFLRLADALGDADMVIAARWHRAAVLPGRRPLARRLESRLFASTVRRLFGLPYRDTQCGAKVFRRDVAEAIVPLLSSRDFLFDVELLIAARALGFRVVEVPTVWVDRAGSRLRAGRDGRRMAMSALRLWVHMKTIPLPEALLPAATGSGVSSDAPELRDEPPATVIDRAELAAVGAEP